MQKEITLSIVIPSRNELDTLPAILDEIKMVLEKEKIGIYEVIIVDNASTDGTSIIDQSYDVRVVKEPYPGYGSALLKGFQEAKGEFVIYFDADGSYHPSYISDILKYLRAGSDMVLCSRFSGVIEKDAMPWLHRYIGTPILTMLIRILFFTYLTDCNSGYRGFRKEGLDLSWLSSTGMEFSSELSIETALQKLSYVEIPIYFQKDRRKRSPHLRTWRDGVRHLMLILRKRFVR